MSADYRQIEPGDEERVLDLWLDAWPQGNRERSRRVMGIDPAFTRRMFVAVSDDGGLVASTHYWVYMLRDADGRPRKTGCVSHVATAERARRQGHARRLMEMTIEAMRDEGCEWTFLYSSEMGRPLYLGLGYGPLPSRYRQGLLSSEAPGTAGGRNYSVRAVPIEAYADMIEPLADIYSAFNSSRPLSVVRAPEYWRTHMAVRLSRPAEHFAGSLFLAYSGESPADPAGYCIASFSDEQLARQEYGLDQILTVDELGAANGHDDAIPALFGAVASNTLAANGMQVGGRVYLPHDNPQIESALGTVFQGLSESEEPVMMALSLAPTFSPGDIRAMFEAPGAMHWHLDEF